MKWKRQNGSTVILFSGGRKLINDGKTIPRNKKKTRRDRKDKQRNIQFTGDREKQTGLLETDRQTHKESQKRSNRRRQKKKKNDDATVNLRETERQRRDCFWDKDTDKQRVEEDHKKVRSIDCHKNKFPRIPIFTSLPPSAPSPSAFSSLPCFIIRSSLLFPFANLFTFI